MNIPFLGNWRKRHGMARGIAVYGPLAERDLEGVAQLFSECELLRDLAARHGVRLDDTAASLEALDQLLPRWRDDPETLSWLGNDAGLYLGTVLVRTVPGARWTLWPNGHPVVELASGRQIEVVDVGHAWASGGTPELHQSYAEAAES
ncbi:DUF6278 family protein [Streptomyces sp. TRM70308]|uniref:DUF6278 family protein n=1 Tax=Streptomyces TaxID=1883 RepID=UPI002248A565|nr:DUF6278 family protein [Streptomyces sp. JHD 1]MCX2971588.1 DUF6278 family protein [Streptomyces sp. JHD 1]